MALAVNLHDIDKLGDPVKCCTLHSAFHSSLCLHYGKVHPNDKSLSDEDIVANIVLFDHISTVTITATRLTTYSKVEQKIIPTSSVKSTFEDPLPTSIALFGISYKVQPFVFPTFLYFNCWQFGHGHLTCRSSTHCAN